MSDEYDVIVCGSGLVECIISLALSQEGKKVLHIDRNSFYGGEGASLDLNSFWKLFRPGVEASKNIDQNGHWNFDLIPKFFMINGGIMKLLEKTRVYEDIQWKTTGSTYVYQLKQDGYFSKGGPKISKVPCNDKEALKSDFMGLLERNRCRNFFTFLQNYDPNDPTTHANIDLERENFSRLIKKFNLSPNILDLVGHAMAFYQDDNFIEEPALKTMNKINLFMHLSNRYQGSPFQYPIQGMNTIFKSFSTLFRNSGGTFYSNRDVEEILKDEEGKVTGVKSRGELIRCKSVICHPSYMIRTENHTKVTKVGKAIRCICILDHPIPNTDDDNSLQIILPHRQTGRKSDISIVQLSSDHEMCSSGYFIAIISTIAESTDSENEIKPALDILGPVSEKFYTISDLYVANSDFCDNIFITNSADTFTHLETASENILEIYKRLTWKNIDLINIHTSSTPQPSKSSTTFNLEDLETELYSH